jgi:hypothetical protein
MYDQEIPYKKRWDEILPFEVRKSLNVIFEGYLYLVRLPLFDQSLSTSSMRDFHNYHPERNLQFSPICEAVIVNRSEDRPVSRLWKWG